MTKTKFQKYIDSFIDSKIKNEFEIYIGNVIEIDENNYTCTVESRGLTFIGVDLRAFSPPGYDTYRKGLIIIPEIGASCVFYTTKLRHSYKILKILEIDRIIIGDDTTSGEEFVLTIDYLNKNIILENKTTNIKLENDKVSIEADKIYLNDSSYTETEPLVRGAKNKTVLDKIADFLSDIYNQILTHIHGTPVGPTTVAMPPTTTQVATKLTEVSSMKSTDIPATQSTQNFTE
jgi:hypothetical protein